MLIMICSKNTNFEEDVKCRVLLSSFIEFHSAVAEKKSKMYQHIRGQGGYLVTPIGTKKTNLVEDVEFLLPNKFH